MKILLTNDDGIHGEGLYVLANFARKLGEVTVFAPKNEQSAKSHAIEIHRPFKVTKEDFLPGIDAYSVESTPADCLRFATLGAGLSFDLVLSGVNKGLNLGNDIVYSATCGAVFEASYCHMPAIALSTVHTTFDAAKRNLDEIFMFVLQNNLLSHNDLYNINIPLSPRGILITRQGGPHFRDHFECLGNNLFLATGNPAPTQFEDLSYDIQAVHNGYISITPLTVSRTNEAAYLKLTFLNQNL